MINSGALLSVKPGTQVLLLPLLPLGPDGVGSVPAARLR